MIEKVIEVPQIVEKVVETRVEVPVYGEVVEKVVERRVEVPVIRER